MDQNLKNRLTGAVILVSLAVIFIPVILEGPDNEWTPVKQGLPEAPKLDYRAPVNVPLPAETPVPVARRGKPPGKPVYKLAEPAHQIPDEAPAVPVDPPAMPHTPTAEQARDIQPEEAAGFANGWYVQVGSFSSEINANLLSKRIEAAGYESGYQQSSTGSRNFYRVLVGPRESREAAQRLSEQLASEFSFRGSMLIENPG